MSATPYPRARRLRLLWLLWLAMLTLWVQLVLFPVSTRWTRAGSAGLLLILWAGLILLGWHRRALRYSLLGIGLFMAVFSVLPGRALPPVEILRGEYVASLRRYDGATYDWGGESPRGIDCSGLIRRGLIDAQFLRGLRTLNPGLVRSSLELWWRDCTAKSLGEGENGTTVHLLDTPSLNELDHSRLLPGDLAVTKSGLHILAFTGGKTWIEADPLEGKVITVSAPAKGNAWFHGPMKIVRWKVLAP